MLEQIQRRTTKLVPGLRDLNTMLLTCVSNIFCVDYSLAASGIFLVFMF